MTRRLDYFWRLFATALAFSLFCVGSVPVICLVIAPISFLIRDRKKRTYCIRWVVGNSFALIFKALRLLRILKLTIEYSEQLNLKEPALIIANHPSFLDVVLIISLWPQVNCVVKSALWKNPLLRWFVQGAGYIPNNSGPRTIADCIAKIRDGESIVIFPEGTRSEGVMPGTLRRGAASVAIQAECPIIPLVITCDPPTLAKGQRWYHIPDRRFCLHLRVKPPIHADFLDGERANRWISSRKFTRILQDFFEHELKNEHRP